MNVLRMALLASLFLIGVCVWAQLPEAEDCDPFAVAVIESPELGYAHIATWVSRSVESFDLAGGWRDWYEAMGTALEYSMLSENCGEVLHVWRSAELTGFVTGVFWSVYDEPAVCDRVAREMVESPKLGFLRISKWLMANLVDKFLEGREDSYGPWVTREKRYAEWLEYALLSENCLVVEQLFRFVAGWDSVHGDALTAGFTDES
ncbi:MAG: hypothetical protein OXG49_10095 [Chloroflexi bacterium]|nr:hypothetical protein [Chloroflexota bacterium]